jgi:caa(3)-type oxidase subunit IV
VNGVNLWIALGIAVAKAGCIIAIFMGVKWSTPLVQMFALCSVAWLVILFTFFLVDYASPSWGLGTPYSDYENPGQKPLP